MGKEADITFRSATMGWQPRGRNPAKSYINAYAADPRKKCET
jgi:hypothetical protein